MFQTLYDQTDIMGSTEAQVLSQLTYDIAYNIHDHMSPASNNPLASVELHPAEDYREYSGLYRTIERYERQKVNETFGLSLLEYLELPTYMVDMLTDIYIASANDASKIGDDVKRELDKQLTGKR